jgi:pimeloyl-ACP methyl ester carboxylesterase
LNARIIRTAVAALCIASAHAQTPPAVTGDWTGTLDVGVAKLRLALHITGAEGALHGTLDSLDQGANGIPIDTMTFQGATLHWQSAKLHATYTGKLSADGNTLRGEFTQGQPFDLDFKRTAATTAATEPKRPQNPVKPYPYLSVDVTYTNPVQKDVLAGTLTVPAGKGPFPAVLLITGSGPQDRDESLMGHKPFLVLSDYLTRRGIAVLRADDRGIGKSTGNFATATTADFATDVEAGIAFLKTRAEVDPGRIGLIGHSEGAIIAPMVAARSKDVAFLVMLAGSGVPGDQIIVEQTRLLALASGAPADAAEQAAAAERTLLTLALKEKASPTLAADLRDSMAAMMPAAQIDGAVQQLTSPWLLYFIGYDPAPALRQLRCPVLALSGSKDLQVPPAQNLPAIRAALAADPHTRIVELPGLNHLFQTAQTGSPAEYAKIEETMAPVALQTIARWIQQQTATDQPDPTRLQ